MVGVGVVGDIDVLPAVAVGVEADEAETGGESRCDASGLADVAEGSVGLVMEQDVVDRPEGLGAAEVRRAVLTRAQLVGAVINVAGDVKVEKTIAVEVAEGGRGRPAVHVGSGRGGDVGEGAVPQVAIETVGAVVAHVHVDPAIVVDVADRDAHAVAGVAQTRLSGDVGIAAVLPAPEEAVGRPVRDTRLWQDVVAVGQVDVEIAVVVEVEKGRAAGTDGREMELVDGARLVDELQPGLIADVGEPWWRGGRGGIRQNA